MNIKVEFKNEDERFKFLSIVSHTMQVPSPELELVEQAFVRFLEESSKNLFKQGGVRKIQVDNQETIAAAANTFFVREEAVGE